MSANPADKSSARGDEAVDGRYEFSIVFIFSFGRIFKKIVSVFGIVFENVIERAEIAFENGAAFRRYVRCDENFQILFSRVFKKLFKPVELRLVRPHAIEADNPEMVLVVFVPIAFAVRLCVVGLPDFPFADVPLEK